VYVVGAGGHARVVIDLLTQAGRPPAGILDRSPTASSLAGVPVLDDGAPVPPDAEFVIAVGDNALRERLAGARARFHIGLHPAASVAGDVIIGPGTVVMAAAVVNAGARIGSHCIVNSGAIIEHDCVLEDYVSVAPGAVIGGAAHIGRGSAVSIGATILHGIRIGRHVVLGAGAVATESLPDNVVAFGCPARIARPRQAGEPYL
jgi:acetyltransferase EpsM